ncbi:MAG: DUF72 domain-containing protein [Gemmataceae bacterium]
MQVWVGTSGYSYTEWVGEFYPPGTRPERMLPFYASRFPLVELNFTFYRPPTRAMLARLADRTPPGFQFLVKLPKTISHDQRPLDLPGFRHAAEGLSERGQLAGVLAQFPQAMHCTRPACDWVSTLAKELAHLGLCAEFRHRSWDRPGLPAWLAELGVSLVAVDAPDLPGLFPRGWAQSTPTAYVRLHSRDAAKWYQAGQDRYDYDYSDAELGEWIDELARREGGTERALLLFNNCQRSQAAVNARRMQTLLGVEAPHLNLVPPPLPVGPRQATLFG